MTSELAVASVKLASLAAEAAAMIAEADPATSTSLVVATGNVPAVEMKAVMAHRRADIIKMSARVQEARTELEAKLAVQLAEASAALAPLAKMVKRLEEGIWTASLYLGRDEEMVTLADGAPAPASEPIVVRQMVLSMDQECAVAASSGGIDAQDIEVFDEWLLADPAHLHQVLPETRGVVVLMPRAAGRDYADPRVQSRMDDANRRSYWLIRNGAKLFRMVTDFNVGDRLVPARDEFTAFFSSRRLNPVTGHYEVVPLEPGSSQWLAAEEGAEARQRHFMRAALILQGLIDRTTVFHPLPSPAVTLLSEESYDAGHVRIVSDAELALGTGREPFRVWLSRLCAQLRPGMRVVGAFDTSEFAVYRYDHRSRLYGNERLSPTAATVPASGVLHRLESRRRDGGLVFLYERTDKRHGYEHGDHGCWGEWPFKQRASCVIYPSDNFILPFDLVDVATMEAYLAARVDRHEYVAMIPLLRAAIAAKSAELDAEAAFRGLLAGEIAKAHGVDVASAAEAVAELVDWWKLANRWHRPLVDPDRQTQAKAIRMISAEFAARRAAATTGATDAAVEAAMVASLRAAHPAVMLVARKRNGSYVALEPQLATPADVDVARQAALPTNVFVKVHSVSATGRNHKVAEWVLPGTSWRRWRVLASTPTWDAWDLSATATTHLSGPEVDEAAASLVATALASKVGPAMVVTYDAAERRFAVWSTPHPPTIDEDHLLTIHPRAIEVTSVTTSWKRTSGAKVALVGSSYAHSSAWHSHDDQGPWAHSQVMWSDPPALAAASSAHARIADVLGRCDHLTSQARAARRSLEDAWKARELARAYERFLEDYADPDLWEGHLKTLRINYPHHSNRSLNLLIDTLVEAGVALGGMSVEQAAVVFADVTSTTPDELLVLADVPTDVADLVFDLSGDAH